MSAVWNFFLTFKHGVLNIFHSVMIEPWVGHFAANCLLFVLSSLGSSDYKLGSGDSKLLVCPYVLPLTFFFFFNLKVISDLDCCKDSPKNFLVNFTQLSKTLTFYETIVNDQTQELLIKHYWLIYRLYFSFIICLSNVPIF